MIHIICLFFLKATKQQYQYRLNNKWNKNSQTRLCALQPSVWLYEKGKVCIQAKWPIRLELIPVSVAWSNWEYFYSPLDGMLVHRRVSPSIKILICRYPSSLYTPGWRGALWELSVLDKNTSQCPQPGLKPDLETSALTMRPPCLPRWLWQRHLLNHSDYELAANSLHIHVYTCSWLMKNIIILQF